MAQGRSLWKQAWSNFLKSIKPKKYWGELRGIDYQGVEYYEAPEGLQNLNRSSRWFVPPQKDNFQQDIPPEWEAWLRHRRKEPPTEEEISSNMQKTLQRIERAKVLEKSRVKRID